MTASTLGPALRHVHALFDVGTTAGLGDDDLLARYARSRDEAAFEGLVRRHGPMVLGACRAILRDPIGAEDAFQATFLILSRKADSIRNGEALAPWLHRVARRVAVRASVESRARRRCEIEAAGAVSEVRRGAADERASVLHEEIDRLPDRYRLPVVLCHLEGLTHAEAACRLRKGERTVRRHLAEALPRLKARLVARGIALTLPALAVLLGGRAHASVSPALVARLGRIARTGQVSPGVATLMTRAASGSGGPGLPLGSALAVGLLASACWFGPSIGAGPVASSPQDPPALAPKSVATHDPSHSQAPGSPGSWTYLGRVVDPDGRPVVGAKLGLANGIDPARSDPRAISDAEGRFRFVVDQKGYGVESGIVDWLRVIARADGFGLGISDGKSADAGRDLTIRLVRDDAPIEGRVLDLEGRPVAGVLLRVTEFWGGQEGDLAPFIKAAKLEGGGNAWWSKDQFLKTRFHLEPGDPTFPPVLTGADGRFRLAGIGRERVVELRAEGPTVRTSRFEALTRSIEPFLIPDQVLPNGPPQTLFRGARFDLILPPSRPIEGVVRDQDTGRPIEGAMITDMKVRDEPLMNRRMLMVRSDARGRYRLEGLPKGGGSTLAIIPPSDQPYLPVYRTVGDSPGLGAEVLDVPLKRGIWARGRLKDEITRKPIAGIVSYHIAGENRHFDEVVDFRAAPMDVMRDMMNHSDAAGAYRVAVLPGPGLLSLHSLGGPYEFQGYAPDQAGATSNYSPLYAGMDQAHAAIDPAEGSEGIARDFALDPGRSVAGSILDPEGRPLPDSMVYGCKTIGNWDRLHSETGFLVESIRKPRPGFASPSSPVTLVFRNEGRHLAGWCDVRYDEPVPIAIHLQPWAEVVGMVVGPTGKPPRKAMLHLYVAGKLRRGNGIIEHKGEPDRLDGEGRFRLEGLAPGLGYKLSIDQGDMVKWVDIPPTEPGMTVDLGSIRVGME